MYNNIKYIKKKTTNQLKKNILLSSLIPSYRYKKQTRTQNTSITTFWLASFISGKTNALWFNFLNEENGNVVFSHYKIPD